MKKLISVLSRLWLRCLTAVLLLSLCLSQALAADLDPGDRTWGGLYQFVTTLFSGTVGVILSLVALALGIVSAITSQHKMLSIIGAIGVPIAIQVGPGIFESLSGAVL